MVQQTKSSFRGTPDVGGNVKIIRPDWVGWTPAQLGLTLRAWYQFNLLTGSNNDPQGSVIDSSGNGFNLTQTGTARPTLVTADLNSLNTLNFLKANVQRYPLALTIVNGGSAGSFYCVYKGTNASDDHCLNTAGSSGNDNHYPYTDNNFYNDFGSNARKTVGAATGPGVTSYRILSIYSAANDWAFFVDGGTGGSSGGTAALFSTVSNTVGWTTVDFHIGAGRTANYDGRVGEVIFTSAKQSTADRQKVEGYLAWKWGLTGNLAAAHPYKNAPPTVW